MSAPGRAFQVDIRYLPGRSVLPDADELPARVQQAVQAAAHDPGDVLVFLPGKAEIEACAQRLRGEFEIVPLHGGLSLDEQRRAFVPARRRRVVLATNVAETSLTLPGIGVVIAPWLSGAGVWEAVRSLLKYQAALCAVSKRLMK